MLWALLLFGILADHLTTEYGVRRHGVTVESNPLFRWVQRRFGGLAALAAQLAVLCPLLWLAQRAAPDAAFVAPLISWLIVANNLLVLVRLRRSRGRAGPSRRPSSKRR
jgi:hypothetical protein